MKITILIRNFSRNMTSISMFRKVRFQKTGPSAGITMATAILSAVTGKPVRADVAMTGEITLRGRVLPIGGLKEKLLAAKNAGMKTVCIPKENEQDLAEISEEIVGDMEIIPVEHMDQVIKAAFV